MAKDRIAIIDKGTKKIFTFSAISDAARHLDVSALTISNRLTSSDDWWEKGDIILSRTTHTKADGKSRKK